MIRFDNQLVDIPCPKCHFKNSVSLKQIGLEDVVICRGCKRNIRLEDHLNSIRKSIRSVHAALADLEETVNKLGRIAIHL